MNQRPFDPEAIKSILDTNKELNSVEQQLIKQVARHGMICQMLEQYALTKPVKSAII